MVIKIIGAALLLISFAASAYQAPPWANQAHLNYARPMPAPQYAYARPRPPVVYQQRRYWRAPAYPIRRYTQPQRKILPKQAPVTAISEPVPPPAAVKEVKKNKPKDSQQAFLQQLKPIVVRENTRLINLRVEVKTLISDLQQGHLNTAGQTRLKSLAKRYRVKANLLKDSAGQTDLLSRIDIIPTSLALAQAVNESAWGTSRFAREGNNLFGIWTYDESKGIVPKGRAPGKKHLVRKFDDLDESVRYYMFTLNSHPAYQALRDTRTALRKNGVVSDGLTLAGGLLKYSAKGEEYVRLIRQIILRYDLAVLDQDSRRSA